MKAHGSAIGIFITAFILLSAVPPSAHAGEASDKGKYRPPILVSSLWSAAGGLLGGVAGIGLGMGLQAASGQQCSGSDFCLPAFPILGFAIGFPGGTAVSFHLANRNYGNPKPFYVSLFWTLAGIGLGGLGAGVAAHYDQPVLATGIYLGMAHVFPAVIFSL